MPWVGWMTRGGGLLDWTAWGFSGFMIFAGTFLSFLLCRGSLCRLLENTLLSAYIYIAGLITALIHCVRVCTVREGVHVEYVVYEPAYYGPFVMSVPAFTVERRKEEIFGLLIAAAYFTASINRVRVFLRSRHDMQLCATRSFFSFGRV